MEDKDIKIAVHNTEGKEVDTFEVDAAVFGPTVNMPAIYQAVNEYRASNRKGLAATKTRGEVSGGGRKPWKQKGTGRARVGSTRSPLWRHGGVVFGPHPRDFSYSIPKKLKNLALKSAIYAKIKENRCIILDDFVLSSPKTKEAAKIFSRLKLGQRDKVLLLLDKINKEMRLALRNIGFLTINKAQDTHTYEVMAHNRVIITKEALQGLIARLKKAGKRKADE